MSAETSVNIRLDSASVFDALKAQVGDWRLQDHAFDQQSDEVRISYDADGAGRIAVTLAFELSREAMAQLLAAARPAA